MQKETKDKIQKFIEHYQGLSAKEIQSYNEEQTKVHFIQPLFEALGWDFTRDVWPETDVSGQRADYAFKLNNITKMYVEAKPLKADLDLEQHAKQAINYAWNKGVTWAILTDFEGIKVFNAQADTRSLQDKLVFEIPCGEYLSDERLELLSKESFLANALEEYAIKYGKKLKKITVNEKLFNDLKTVRAELTKELIQWNDKISQETLEEGVQRIIERLMFIRVLEDKGLEDPILTPLLRDWEQNKNMQLFPKLITKFRELDGIYNSNLFLEHACEKWQDYSVKWNKIFALLRGSQTYEYDFSKIPADILGGVYESYLSYIAQSDGKVESKSKSRQKRKEQGIFYTPKFIVDYIVEHTLGEKLKEVRSVNELKQLRILDPACGSGSFLTQALKTMNDKYKDFNYPGDQYTKSEILLSNIYGVDLDAQAVELAKLNLLIEALDKKAKLPNLTGHIRVGNSLISGSDEELKKYFGESYRDKRPFNWQEEFPEVFKQGGFDVVIGNPPYIFARGGNFNEQEKKYYANNFELLQYQLNTFLLFIERGTKLLKDGGYFGFIIPNNWLTINSFSKLREYILKNTADLKIINAIDPVFAQASVDSCILVFKKEKPTTVELGELRESNLVILNKYQPSELYDNNFIINIAKSKSGGNSKTLNIFNSCIELNTIAKVSTGLKAYQMGKGRPPQTEEIKNSRKFHSKEKINSTYNRYLDGVDVKRYNLGWSGEYLSYGEWLAEPRRSVPFNGPRILVRQIPAQPPYCINGAFTDEDYLNDINSMVIFNPAKDYDLKYILGIINSRLLSYWFINTFDKFQRKIFPQFKVNELAKFPIYPADKKQQKQVITLVDKILMLNKQLQATPENSDKWADVKREIEKTDKKIDEKVFELYGLGEEERKVITKK